MIHLEYIPKDIPGLVSRSYEKQDMAKFQEGLPTWKDWLPTNAYTGWCDFVTQVNENAPVAIDSQSTHWPLDNICGTYKADKDRANNQPRRISDRDAAIPQVNVNYYYYSCCAFSASIRTVNNLMMFRFMQSILKTISSVIKSDCL